MKGYRDAGADEVVLLVGARDASGLVAQIDGLVSSILESGRDL